MHSNLKLSGAQLLFLILHGLTIAFLCNFLIIHTSEDHSKEIYGTILGLIMGGISGFFIFRGLMRKLKTTMKAWLSFIALLSFELVVGLMIVIPYIFMLTYFHYPGENHSICCETPKDYGAQEFENINIVRAHDENISGWYIPPTAKSSIIILVHGANSDRRATNWYAKHLVAAGYGVLAYDLRGHGESFGKLTLFNEMEKHTSDLLAVVEFINHKKQITSNQIAVLGLSLGAYITLNLSPQDLNKFSALWMDGLRGENIGAESISNNLSDAAMNILMKPINPIGEIYSGEKAPQPTLNFITIIPTISKPKLMIVASGLDVEENTINRSFISVIKDNKQIWFIENAWHIGGHLVAENEYRSRMLDFFDTTFREN